MTRALQLLAALVAVTSCRVLPPAPAIPIEGSAADVSAFAGEWAGDFWSKETGRRGTIRFRLAEQADSGRGELEITFSPALSLLRNAAGADPKSEQPEPERSRPCTVIGITVVRIESDSVRGTTASYWDPDCDCEARSTFEGKRSGARIEGKFSTIRASSDRRILEGRWQVDRQG